jgi:hypothetical protein
MKTSSLTPEMLAAFAARGGSVKKAAMGEGLGLTNRQWYRKARDEVVERVVVEHDIDAEQRQEMAMEAFHQARHCGASQEAAMDDYNYVRNRR